MPRAGRLQWTVGPQDSAPAAATEVGPWTRSSDEQPSEDSVRPRAVASRATSERHGGADHWLPAAICGSLVLGFALPYVFLATLNLAQSATPNELQGRVSAALTLALFGPQAPTQALGSLLISHTTYITIYIASAALSLAIGIWLVLQPPAAET